MTAPWHAIAWPVHPPTLRQPLLRDAWPAPRPHPCSLEASGQEPTS